MTLTKLTLWDSTTEPYESVGEIYSWNGYAEYDSVYSLLKYVEIYGDRLRDKYLAWTHDLGEKEINGKRVIDHLVIENDFSFWWMTRFVEKSFFKSPITDAIRLLAFEEIVTKKNPEKVQLVSNNRKLHIIIRDLCRRMEINYEWHKLARKRHFVINVRNIYRKLPQSIKALIILTQYLWQRSSFKQTEKLDWFSGQYALFICSYFFNFNHDLAQEGKFRSRYWEGLHRLTYDMGIRENWLQLYIPHENVATPAVATAWLKQFNQIRDKEGFHSFLDCYLTWNIVLRVIKQWFWLWLVAWRLRTIGQAFYLENTQISLWPIMREDWAASIIGPDAVSNLLWIELFDKALHEIPHQKKGLYLCENQPWEVALVKAWRKYGHGQLIAVPHSTIRFWDLRYFSDPRIIRSNSINKKPQPDFVALNGKAAVDSFLSVDYPKEKIIECEALRFGYFNHLQSTNIRKKSDHNKLQLLILGDYSSTDTIKMLKLLELAILKVATPIKCIMKPHPNYYVAADEYPTLKLNIVTEPLNQIIHEYDIAYTSNITSAAVDAYLAGLPVVVMLDDTELNFSPLRGKSGVHFVSTPEELADALQKINTHRNTSKHPDYGEFFFLEPELSRWRQLLSHDVSL